jgi:hypothetical protein
VPTLLRMASRWTFADLSPLELSGESSQSVASEHTLLTVRRRCVDFCQLMVHPVHPVAGERR